MPMETPGLTYKWSAKMGKYRVTGGRRNRRKGGVVKRTSQNRRRIAAYNQNLTSMGMPKSTFRLAKTAAMRNAARARRGKSRRRAA